VGKRTGQGLRDHSLIQQLFYEAPQGYNGYGKAWTKMVVNGMKRALTPCPVFLTKQGCQKGDGVGSLGYGDVSYCCLENIRLR
jgi:hypothetical protein